MIPKKNEHIEPILKCPRCSVPMKKLKRKDVTVDVCPKCGGMWLDNSEIDKILSLEEKE